MLNSLFMEFLLCPAHYVTCGKILIYETSAVSWNINICFQSVLILIVNHEDLPSVIYTPSQQ